MPATSERQRTLFCIAESIKKGKTSRNYSKQATKLANTMSLEKLKEYCEAPIAKKGG